MKRHIIPKNITSVAFSPLKSLPRTDRPTHIKISNSHPAILLQRNYHKDINQNTEKVHSTVMFKAGQRATSKK